jgi:essential nuclear protein 1
MPKATAPGSRNGRRHNPLEADILATGVLKNKPSKSKKKDEGDKDSFVDSKASKKILQLGRELAEEDAANNTTADTSKSPFDADAARQFGFDVEEEEEDDDGAFDNDTFGDEDDVQEEYGGEIEVEDLDTFNKFLPSGGDDNPLAGWDKDGDGDNNENQGGGTNLADLILAKIAQQEAGMGGREPMADAIDEDYELPPKVVEVYTQYGYTGNQSISRHWLTRV